MGDSIFVVFFLFFFFKTPIIAFLYKQLKIQDLYIHNSCRREYLPVADISAHSRCILIFHVGEHCRSLPVPSPHCHKPHPQSHPVGRCYLARQSSWGQVLPSTVLHYPEGHGEPERSGGTGQQEEDPAPWQVPHTTSGGVNRAVHPLWHREKDLPPLKVFITLFLKSASVGDCPWITTHPVWITHVAPSSD